LKKPVRRNQRGSNNVSLSLQIESNQIIKNWVNIYPGIRSWKPDDEARFYDF
jgi:hypothetical protein